MDGARRILGWLGLALLAGQAGAQQRGAPNIVLILADDVGVEGFECYGGESYATPHIDALAARGVRFEHCHSQPLCTPSRVKLMTGLSNARNYTEFSILRPGERTFGHLLAKRGYDTAVIGKWQLYGAKHYGERAGKGSLPANAGFEQHCLWQVTELGSRYWGPLLDQDGELEQYEQDVYGPDVFLEYAAEFVRRDREGPFFLYYPMALPHDPFKPTPLSEDTQSRSAHANFRDMLQYVDRQVGRLVELLEQEELLENTLVMFTSDNGTHQRIRSRQGGREVRGAKSLTLDTGTHVPLVVAGPGVERGGVCEDLIDFADFLPTLMEVSGSPLDVEHPSDGVSFWPQLQGLQGNPRRSSYTYYHPRPGNPRIPKAEWVRTRYFKLYSDGRLFDVRRDPLEERPLAADEERFAEIRRELEAALASAPGR